LKGELFNGVAHPFDCTILNPPYKKIRTDSPERRLLRDVGVETSNLYTAFVALALRLVRVGGELIAITPRSFCNGPYFTPFRRDLLALGNLSHLHVFDSRDVAFGEDEVLQENVIFRLERGVRQQDSVEIAWSDAGDAEHTVVRAVPFTEVVSPDDADRFIHVTPDEWDTRIAEIVRSLPGTLKSLNVSVSTGRVVDFRVKDFLRSDPEPGTVPLIYPSHCVAGKVAWPKPHSRKPNAVVRARETADQINPAGTYVLVKRFTSKEERRRVVATVISPTDVPGDYVAFENHLNYFHLGGAGLPQQLARGLAAFLNSTIVDLYFRQFNGHTQVNASDLRKLHYPDAQQLETIGRQVGGSTTQAGIDELVEEVIVPVASSPEPISSIAQARIAEAQAVLKSLGLPREQYNERSAIVLLGMLNLTPDAPWSGATNPTRGTLALMDFAKNYGKAWQPNTRETIRRRTLHQFRDGGVVVENPDFPDRAVNSPAFCYQVPDTVLELLRTYGGPEWDARLRDYLVDSGTLAAKYASERDMRRIPLRMEGVELSLSPGGQNDLIREIINGFCPRFTPGAVPLYIGDADKKWGHFDKAALDALGVHVGAHGKMPDVVVYLPDKNWLVLIEAVTSHGPIDPKRRGELRALFGDSTAPLVYVTAFMTRAALKKYLPDIAWETEVWIAESPTHLIHFNGERFLGPYE